MVSQATVDLSRQCKSASVVGLKAGGRPFAVLPPAVALLDYPKEGRDSQHWFRQHVWVSETHGNDGRGRKWKVAPDKNLPDVIVLNHSWNICSFTPRDQPDKLSHSLVKPYLDGGVHTLRTAHRAPQVRPCPSQVSDCRSPSLPSQWRHALTFLHADLWAWLCEASTFVLLHFVFH